MKNKTILLLAVGDGADDVNAPKYRAALHQFNGRNTQRNTQFVHGFFITL